MPIPEKDRSAATLETHGLPMWFLMDYPRLAGLLGAPGDRSSATPRARFLGDALALQPRPGVFEGHLAIFEQAGDREGQYAAAGAGVLAIWNSGADLHRYGYLFETPRRIA